MHRNLLLLATITIALVASANTSELFADDRAATDELPAALLALDHDNSRILSESEADAVRGEVIGPIIFARSIALTNPFTGITQTVFAIGYSTTGVNVFAIGSIVGDPVDFNVNVSPSGVLTVNIQ